MYSKYRFTLNLFLLLFRNIFCRYYLHDVLLLTRINVHTFAYSNQNVV